MTPSDAWLIGNSGKVYAGGSRVSTLVIPNLATHSWFHGKITREQAERLLYPPETGLFLVRESTNYPGDYTLCVSCEGKVEHYRIMYHASKLSIDEEVYFENLMQLVEVSGVHACLGVILPFLTHTRLSLPEGI
jgi:hypothetical protein